MTALVQQDVVGLADLTDLVLHSEQGCLGLSPLLLLLAHHVLNLSKQFFLLKVCNFTEFRLVEVLGALEICRKGLKVCVKLLLDYVVEVFITLALLI